MRTKVLKFGGSSLADAAQFEKVAAIIRSDEANRYIVVSAPGKRYSDDIKVTDLLYKCFELARKDEDISEVYSLIEDRYRGIIADLGLDLSLEKEFRRIRTTIEHHGGKDYVASRGEYLNARIMSALMGYTFIDAEEGIFFCEDGSLDVARTDKTLGALLAQAEHAIIPGFYGAMPNGTIRTFSRGGSDITGSIVARAARADIYENWTDVSGMLMADPRIIDNPRVIEEITYRELRELAYMGATVMHEEAIFPVQEAGIPINIRNTNIPTDPGTMIVPHSDRLPTDTVITGVAGIKGFCSINIEKDKMNREVGFGRKVLSALEAYGISFEHIPSGIDTMSVIVRNENLASNGDVIVERIYRDTHADHVAIEGELALIAVVGRGMVQAKGTAGRIFRAIADCDINIRMIDQGSSENNIIVGVSEADYSRALQAIYDEFVGGTAK